MSAIAEDVVLDRIQLYDVELLDRELLDGMRKGVRVCTDQDAYEMRRKFTGWGKVERRTLTCPATWWDHLKQALRLRWPRLFTRLRVNIESVTVENGAVVTGLGKRLGGRHLVIPIGLPTTRMGYIADNSDDDTEQL